MRITPAVAAGLVVAVFALQGCARSPESLGQMGCRSIDEFLPEFDAVHAGESPSKQLSDRITEEMRLDYFDNETGGLYRLLGEETQDQFDVGYTPVDVDYSDIRSRAVDYCSGEMDWPLDNV